MTTPSSTDPGPPQEHDLHAGVSTGGGNERAAALEATSFARFLETMKAPQATDLVRRIRTFVRNFESQQPSRSGSRSRVVVDTTAVQENNSALVGSFLTDMEVLMADHVLFGGAAGSDPVACARKVEEGVEGLEKYIMSKLYGMTFQVASDEADKDDRCHRLCRALAFLDVNTVIGSRGCSSIDEETGEGGGEGNDGEGIVEGGNVGNGDARGQEETRGEKNDDRGNDGLAPSEGGAEPKLDDYCVAILDAHIERAQEQVLAMDKYKAPKDKLVCLMNAQALLEEGIRRVNASDTSLSFAGADAFFPMVVLTVVRAAPSALYSNIQYIRRFRGPHRLGGQCDFMLSCLESVALYLDTVDWKDLGIGRDAWMGRLRDAGIPEAALDGAGGGSGSGHPIPGVEKGTVIEDARVGVADEVRATRTAESLPGSDASRAAGTSTDSRGARADLVALLIEEGTPLVLNEESEGRLLEKYPWIYSDAGDVQDARVVDQLLSAYRDLVVKHEALKLAIQNGSELLRQATPDSGSGGDIVKKGSSGGAGVQTARVPLVTDLVQRMSLLSSGWSRGDTGSAAQTGNTSDSQRGTTTTPHLLSSLFGGGTRSTAPMLSPVVASVGRTDEESNKRSDTKSFNNDDGDVDDSESFDAATAYVESTALGDKEKQLPASVLLELYALFKQATVGSCTSQNIPRPGIFDPKGRAKHDAWLRLGDLPPRAARQRYVATLTRCRPTWREHENSTKPKPVVGPVFSVPKIDEEQDDDEEFPRVIQLVQDGDPALLEAFLQKDPSSIHNQDSEGCTCLHWAADKGTAEVVELLLSHGADKGATDVDGLTPLEYALLRDERDPHRSRIVETLQ